MNSAIEFNEYYLDNGLHVILSESHNAPLVVTNLWYHVGSKDEDPRRTGFAHLFEHLMFQGSKHVGKAEHFKYVQNAGGMLNATTNSDRTNYFETLPSSELELALWLESDRMLTLDVSPENFENQRDVVKEERRQRYDNQPYGTVWENVIDRLFPPTTGYHWTTIGSMAHLEETNVEEVRQFHERWYKPDNCSLALVGDFDEMEARRLIEYYFGGIPKSNGIERPTQVVTPLTEQVRLTMYDNVRLPAIYIVFQGGASFSREEIALDMASDILSNGRSSRLYSRLVWEEKIAKDVSAYQYGNELAGAFVVTAKVHPDQSLERAEAMLWEEIARIGGELVTESELAKSRNQNEAVYVGAMTELARRADHLQRAYTFLGDTSACNRELDRMMSVDRETIRSTAAAYLSPEKAVVVTVLPNSSR